MPSLKDLLDVIRGLKRKKRGPKVCPRCGSPRIRLSSSLDVWLTPEKYICNDCGYLGPIVMEIEEENEGD